MREKNLQFWDVIIVCTASTGDWQARIADLEGKVSAQANEIQSHIEAIAILENQKLDLIQGKVIYLFIIQS